jgi:mannose-6-phosphate isomerase-like protein (cupin superfamily)
MQATTAIDAVRQLGAVAGPDKLARDDGEVVDIGAARVRLMVRGPESLGGFSLVEYHISPRTLVAPMHRHTWEDEYSFVLEGRLGAMLGEEVVHADPGELVFKGRRQWHTIWNPSDAPTRVLEVISPGGFELFFAELGAAIRRGDSDRSTRGELGARYGLGIDFESVRRLRAEQELEFRLA